MSKGNQPIKARVTQQLFDRILAAISRRNRKTSDAEWTMSDWIRISCEEKLAKMNRSRKRKTQSSGLSP